jgi:hypothetical protein
MTHRKLRLLTVCIVAISFDLPTSFNKGLWSSRYPQQAVPARDAYNSVMPRIIASIQENPMAIVIIFIEGQRRIGPILRCRDEETVFRVLRRAHANLESLSIVEMSLRARRPCTVNLTLTDEQYNRLKNHSRPNNV